MPNILPPFADLIAFDAAARHGTFTRAARDLNVSQPAVSRRIAALEADLGTVLFERASKPFRLTATGEKLFDVLRSGLSRLEATVEEIRKPVDGDSVTISAGAGFAAFWLIPRLPQLQAAFPNHDLRILSGGHSDDEAQGDLQVRFGDGAWPGAEATKILGEEVFAVCSPFLLAGRAGPMDLEAIKSARLLRLPEAISRWYGWRTWFKALGSPLTVQTRSVDFDSYSHLVGAALAGQGIALAWDGLLDQFLESGALVRVSEKSVRSSRGYYVTHSRDAPRASIVREISTWLAGHVQI